MKKKTRPVPKKKASSLSLESRIVRVENAFITLNRELGEALSELRTLKWIMGASLIVLVVNVILSAIAP